MRVSNPMSDEKLSDMGHPDFDEGELLLRRGCGGTVAAGPQSAGSALTACWSGGLSRATLWTRSAGLSGSALTAVAQPGPLIGREDGANAQQHFGVRLLQIGAGVGNRSEEHTSELQSLRH